MRYEEGVGMYEEVVIKYEKGMRRGHHSITWMAWK